MAIINHAKREINVKIVYYGPAGAGKGASLRYIYDRIKPSLRGELKTVPASGDSLLFFDFSPFEVPQFGGYRIRFHMYCLTGKVSNPAAWKMTLKGADGVVIVADIAPEMLPASRESISELREFLAAYGVGLHDLPCVLQLSGADNTARSGADLDLPDMQSCFADPGSGEGILEALSLLSRDVMVRVGQEQALRAVERPVTAEESGESATPAPLNRESEEHALYLAESAQAIAEELFLPAEEQLGDADGAQGLQVALAGEAALSAGGSVRIPLEISLGGATRRLVVSIAVEEG